MHPDEVRVLGSQPWFEDLYEHAPDMCVSVSPETGRVLYCNATAAERTGYSKDEIIGRPVIEMYHPDCRGRALECFRRFQRTGAVSGTELQLRRADGEPIDVLLKVSAVRDEQGEILYSRSTWTDISELKAIQAELERHREQLEREVERRTRQLACANAELERLALVAARTSNLVVIADREGTIEWVNEAFTRVSGYASAEAVGRKPWELLEGPETDPAAVARIQECVRRFESYNVTVQYHAGDGRPYWVSSSAQAVPGRDGRPPVYITVEQEITEQREYQRALQESEERLDRAVRGTSDGLWDWDPRSGKTWLAPRFKELLGYGDGELASTYEAWESRLHPEDRGRVLEQVRRHLEEGQPYDAEYRLKTRSGEYRWFRARGRAARDERGRPARMAGSISDVTEARRASEELTRLSEESRTLLDAVPTLIWVKDGEGRIVRVNRAAAEFAGRPAGELVGLASEMVYAEQGEGARADDLEVLRTGEARLGSVQLLRAGRRKELWVNTDKIPIADPSGGVGGILVVSTDLSAVKQAERLRHYASELRRSNKALDEFAYVASHDLRAPLRAIDNLALWAIEDSGDELGANARAHLEKLRLRAARMDRLLTDLLAYSRAGRRVSSLEEFPSGPLVRDVVQTLDVREGIRVEVDPALPVMVSARPPLEQVFLNLIDNAVKHHDRPEGRVRVAARDLGHEVEFSVTDDGPGIAPEFHERVFGMFQTLRPQAEQEGCGMGLALVRRLVEAHGGRIGLESGEGRGCTFRFTWPTSSQPAEVHP